MKREKLNSEQIENALNQLNGWQTAEDKLTKKYAFQNFAESLAFVNQVGELAEAADHHPDILFGWGYAEIDLTTHDRQGITDVDIALAGQIDGLK